MGDLSPHFSLAEFATCRASDRCPTPMVDAELVCRLEELRKIIGNRPIRIVSGYRCLPCNKRVGGARRSQHMAGKAADIPAGVATVDQARRAGFRGIGRKGAWAIHVDTRTVPSEWSY